MSRAKIRGIFFDLDDTLIHYTEAERSALAVGCRMAAQAHHGISERALAMAIFQIYERRFCHGTEGFRELATLSVEEFRFRLTSEALGTFGVEDPTLVRTLVDAYRVAERAALRTIPDVRHTLSLLSPHFRLGIITNGPSAGQREKIAAVALSEWFSEIIVDTEFGHPKPDRRIFDHAAERIGLPPEALLFVGNSLPADVAGAKGAGWTAVHLDLESRPAVPRTPCPDFTISGLAELLLLPPIAVALTQSGTPEMVVVK